MEHGQKSWNFFATTEKMNSLVESAFSEIFCKMSQIKNREIKPQSRKNYRFRKMLHIKNLEERQSGKSEKWSGKS